MPVIGKKRAADLNALAAADAAADVNGLGATFFALNGLRRADRRASTTARAQPRVNGDDWTGLMMDWLAAG
jgi:uncharacterized membrane protein